LKFETTEATIKRADGVSRKAPLCVFIFRVR